MHIDTAHSLVIRTRRKARRDFTPVELNALANAILTAQHFSPTVKDDPVTSGLYEGWTITP